MGLATSPAEYVEWFTKKMKRYGVLYRPGDHEPSEVLDRGLSSRNLLLN
jgi:hypothetical protein